MVRLLANGPRIEAAGKEATALSSVLYARLTVEKVADEALLRRRKPAAGKRAVSSSLEPWSRLRAFYITSVLLTIDLQQAMG